MYERKKPRKRKPLPNKPMLEATCSKLTMRFQHMMDTGMMETANADGDHMTIPLTPAMFGQIASWLKYNGIKATDISTNKGIDKIASEVRLRITESQSKVG